MLHSMQRNDENVESLKGIIGWFNQNSVELIDEYRRLERQVHYLQAELQAKNRELEQSLDEREQGRIYLLSVLESLKGGVLVVDADFVPTFRNRRLGELVGVVDQTRVRQILGDRLIDCLKRGEGGCLPFECEKIIRGPQAMIPVHMAVSAVSGGADPSDYIVVFQDISLLKRLEEESARSNRLASLGIMAAEVAHQLRSPMGGIELSASLLRDQAKNESKKLADEILHAVRRLSTTLDHLLTFASEPSVSASMLPVPVLLKDVMQDCMPLFDDPLWSILFERESSLPPLWGDRGLLVQALLNLIINGKEAMPQGGRVLVRAKLAPLTSVDGQMHRGVEISVRDSGTGIAEQNRQRIFDPFFTTKGHGTGLGLAFVHKIIHAHRGSIDIVSQVGQGAEFIVRLPAVEEGS